MALASRLLFEEVNAAWQWWLHEMQINVNQLPS
jgi:hypothetical protein